MATKSRRGFLKAGAGLGAGASLASVGLAPLSGRGEPGAVAADPGGDLRAAALARADERVSLNGAWQFRLDPDNRGDKGNWQLPETPPAGWADVRVPHTWQTASASADYYGVGWYRRDFVAPAAWQGDAVRVEFEGVFHSARVWMNGRQAGEHLGKGYTAFTLDIGRALRYGARNVIVVRADNAFNEAMLPRGRSSDWTHDGGIYRPVTLLVSPAAFIERIAVDAIPDLAADRAALEITAVVRNAGAGAAAATLGYRVIDEDTGQVMLEGHDGTVLRLAPGAAASRALPAATLASPKLWHFDRPQLYRLEVMLVPQGARGSRARDAHCASATFGVRSFETRDRGFYLNGERVRLMGVERMAGSHPDYGMAEPSEWIAHDHDDMKALNCVFTRVHWPQDRRVLDYCDRRGMLIQLEVPTWGPATFEKMGDEPLPALMANGLEQLTELIEQNRNHPSVVSWGLCNEIGGQNPAAYSFAKRMYEEAKRLDPRRPRAYASHSLLRNPARDVTALMDLVEFNEYYGSWYEGGPDALRKNLDEIHQAFPDKAIVISEYGYCACTADRPEGDGRRTDTLREHDRVFRGRDDIAGLIFFCYNDYRTHQGDKGRGIMKQRVHGVVDVYGAHKLSYEALRGESSPVAGVRASLGPKGSLIATVWTRKDVPAYALDGYTLRWVVYDARGTPIEKHEAMLPRLAPGAEASVPLVFEDRQLSRLVIDVMRPTGFSAFTTEWRP